MSLTGVAAQYVSVYHINQLPCIRNNTDTKKYRDTHPIKKRNPRWMRSGRGGKFIPTFVPLYNWKFYFPLREIFVRWDQTAYLSRDTRECTTDKKMGLSGRRIRRKRKNPLQLSPHITSLPPHLFNIYALRHWEKFVYFASVCMCVSVCVFVCVCVQIESILSHVRGKRVRL